MSEEINQATIKKTQQLLGKHIKKPPLTDKLLSKPPFRFLHDVVVAIVKNTGFLKGLFTQDELVPDNVKERESKLAFLNKLIDAIKFVTKKDLKVRASKIVAGVQVNETNLLLQAIAYGIDNKLDASEYINRNKNAQNNSKNEINKGTLKNKESKVKKSPKDEKSPVENKNKENRSQSKAREPSKDRKIVKDKKDKPPIASSRTSKTDTKSTKSDKPKKVKEIDSPDSIEQNKVKTSSSDAKFIEKTEAELGSITINQDTVESSNIVTEETNNNLQKVADVDERPRTRDIENGYLAKLNKDEITENADVEEVKPDIEQNSEVLIVESEKSVEVPVIRQTSARPKSARPKNGEFKERIAKSLEDDKKHVRKSDINENIVLQTNTTSHRPRSSLRPPSVRPSSARPGAPRLRPDSALPIQEVIPMGKINVIIENFDNDADEEETIVIHNAPEENMTVEPMTDLPAKNQSHLVNQILDQIKDSEDMSKDKNEADWEQDNLQGRDTTSKEMNHLRNLIQSFTKTANPLGKLLNYLHEDIETMHAELQQWTKIKTMLFAEITKQEKIKLDMEKPLLEKLENLKEDIVKQEQEIIHFRSNIIKNDIRIKDLINK